VVTSLLLERPVLRLRDRLVPAPTRPVAHSDNTAELRREPARMLQPATGTAQAA
jgi:hypothetical protein